jgi:steroid 5-alpha reductase family enzyme
MDWLFFVLNPVFRYIFISFNLVALICWIATLITNNYSHVDRIWSILPPVYAIVFLFTGIYFQGEYSILPGNGWSNTRLALMTMLVVAWGARLTFNFWRKGGYNLKNEDYRWIHVQKLFNYPEKKILYHIFNLVFTAFIQIWLLVGLVLPMWFIQTNDPNRPYQENLNWLDCILVVLFAGLLAIETIADQQQWNFQTAKYEWINSEKDGKPTDKFTPEQIQNFKRGFLIHGLFSFTRHPNFCAEISMWWIFYLFRYFF